jgi:hypothetical protein
MEKLLGSFAPPLHRLGIVFRDAQTVSVSNAEVVLSPGIPLFGSFADPFRRLGIVSNNASTRDVKTTSYHVALLSSSKFSAVLCSSSK